MSGGMGLKVVIYYCCLASRVFRLEREVGSLLERRCRKSREIWDNIRFFCKLMLGRIQ